MASERNVMKEVFLLCCYNRPMYYLLKHLIKVLVNTEFQIASEKGNFSESFNVL